MKHKKITYTSIVLILALLLTGFTSRIAQAETPPGELEYEGVVIEVLDDGGFTFTTEDDIKITVGPITGDSFDLSVEGEDTLTVTVEEGFEFGTIEKDGEFELEIEYDEDSEEWMLSKAEFEAQEEENGEEENTDDAAFCSESGEEHPVAAAIAGRYGAAEYDNVIGMFCDGGGPEGSARTGFGQIMLAFHTAEMIEEKQGDKNNDPENTLSAEDILNRRSEGEGWGQIWKELGLIGKPDHAGPDDAGKPNHAGRPDHADRGKPENVGPPDHANKPDHAGPKNK